ncbi:hypothetical protein EJ04DRAFT_598620 [Polyplosphaeria fusca]|uniref:Uncharacterized protein n=1 Tax=Polyplosphaeria fusca TaxID=682080 RepID=A0A9P4UVD0_9PLEO|nr:hypothetical protein EJ04DRAFT_598620 [Polyplosphaeria fusca]
MDNTNPVTKWPFYALTVLGTMFLWGGTLLDGSMQHLLRALHGPEDYILPGTQTHLRQVFTGIYWPIDYLLDVLVIFFWEVADGSHPATSVIGIYFLGQLLCVLVNIYLDSLRNGNAKSFGFLRTTIWAMIFQMTGIGCTGAIWALSYISSSPLSKVSLNLSELQTASMAPPNRVVAIVPSLALGYICTAIFSALPSPTIISYDTKQIALVSWNVYPILVLLPHWLLSTLTSSPQSATPRRSHIRAVRVIYALSAAIGTFIHIGVVAISLSTLLFPMLFSPAYLDELHPASLALPPVSITQGRTIGDGIRSFFLWDQVFGYTSAILVALKAYEAACTAKGTGFSWRRSALGTFVASAVVGPGVACLGLGWLRDELLFGGKDEEGRQKK